MPEGLWQVKYEKEGYETAYSEWLPVPPSQTEVNIGMVSLQGPNVKLLNIFKDKSELVFNKYMDIKTINNEVIQLLSSEGEIIDITVESYDSIVGHQQKQLANKFIVKIKNGEFIDNELYTFKIGKSIESYAGVNSSAEIVIEDTLKDLPEQLILEPVYRVNSNETIDIKVSTDKTNISEKINLLVKSDMNEIVEVSNDTVELNNDGTAVVGLKANIPGETKVTLTVEGTDITVTTNIKVLSGEVDLDFNQDGVVDIIDLDAISMYYNKKIDDKEWEIKLDLHYDNIIDIFDLTIMSQKVS